MTPDPKTPSGRAELRRLCDAATKGPWRLSHDAQGPCMVMHPTRSGVAIVSSTSSFRPCEGFHDDWYTYTEDGNYDQKATVRRIEERNGNVELIAAARTAVPELLDKIERLERELAETPRVRVRNRGVRPPFVIEDDSP